MLSAYIDIASWFKVQSLELNSKLVLTKAIGSINWFSNCEKNCHFLIIEASECYLICC